MSRASARLIPFALCLALGCATSQAPRGTWSFFAEPPATSDTWSRKIDDWQERQRMDRAAGRPMRALAIPPSERLNPFGDIGEKFDEFLRLQKRDVAAAFTEWSQKQARRHYRADPETDLAGDPWPTVEEFFATNGDDCDGLDLMAYGALREVGFGPRELYRLILRRDEDGAHHMVTLWFEERADPWVIDATGAAARKMRRFSELGPGWTPVRMFNEEGEYGTVFAPAASFELAVEPDPAARISTD